MRCVVEKDSEGKDYRVTDFKYLVRNLDESEIGPGLRLRKGRDIECVWAVEKFSGLHTTPRRRGLQRIRRRSRTYPMVRDDEEVPHFTFYIIKKETFS